VLLRLDSFFQRYFAIFLVAGVALGILVPGAAVVLSPATLPCLGVLVFFPSLKIRYRELLSSLSQRPGLFLLALLGVFGLVPLLMYALGRVAGLSPLLLTGLVLASAAPSMVSSPFFTGLIHGDIGFAFTVAVSSTLLAPLTIPLTVYLLLGQSTTLQLSYLVRTASLVIFAPALLAALVRRYVPRTAAQILSAEHICTTVAIVILNSVIIGSNRAAMAQPAAAFLPLFALGLVQNFGVFFLTRNLSRRLVPDPLSKAMSVVFGLKNVALIGGLFVALNQVLALPAAVISLAHVLMFVMIGSLRERL